MTPFALRQAASFIHQGNVIAYPTEAVFGLGCDPLNPYAVERLLNMKQRSIHKGLILIASDFKQLQPFVKKLTEQQLKPALDSWPGPNTWIFPCREDTPYWLTGKHQGIAVRVTSHPIAEALCRACGSALVSTSANAAGQPPARNSLECRLKLPGIDLVVPGTVEKSSSPSTIRDLLSGKTLRA